MAWREAEADSWAAVPAGAVALGAMEVVVAAIAFPGAGVIRVVTVVVGEGEEIGGGAGVPVVEGEVAGVGGGVVGMDGTKIPELITSTRGRGALFVCGMSFMSLILEGRDSVDMNRYVGDHARIQGYVNACVRESICKSLWLFMLVCGGCGCRYYTAVPRA